MNIFKKILFSFTKEGIEAQRIAMIQQKCKHEHWNCNKKLKIIECKSCGLKAWVDDYVDLYKK
jgi:hypothetical protein